MSEWAHFLRSKNNVNFIKRSFLKKYQAVYAFVNICKCIRHKCPLYGITYLYGYIDLENQ